MRVLRVWDTTEWYWIGRNKNVHILGSEWGGEDGVGSEGRQGTNRQGQLLKKYK